MGRERSSGAREAIRPRGATQIIPNGPNGGQGSGDRGEPKLRQLEPDWAMAQPSRGPPTGCRMITIRFDLDRLVRSVTLPSLRRAVPLSFAS